MDWFEGFEGHKKKLNAFGLFCTYDDALAFAKEYSKVMHNGNVGDGGVEAYICRVSTVVL